MLRAICLRQVNLTVSWEKGRLAVFQPVQKDGLVWIDFNRDIASFLQKRRAGQLTTGAWLRSIIRARSFAYFCTDDPWPNLAAFWELMVLVTRYLGRLLGKKDERMASYN